MKSLLKSSATAFIAAAITAIYGTASAQSPVITVKPALAPNAFGSPSYGSWVFNANTALYNGASSGGTFGLPTYYNQISGAINIQQMIVTGFPSWNGYADPGTVFGPAFANELGNRPLMGVVIDKAGGSQFSISQLSFSMTSTDPANGLNFGFGAGSYNYSTDYWGVLFGLDGVWGGGDDSFITSGPNTQLVDGLVGRGSGNAWAAYDTDPGATQQDKINNLLADPNFANSFTITGTYSIGDTAGNATISVVPEPSSMALAALGGLSLMAFSRRRV